VPCTPPPTIGGVEEVLAFVSEHGVPVVFAVVFLDQAGLPLPTVPILVALGALAGAGRIDPGLSLAAAVSGSLCADYLWYRLGRWNGRRVLAWVCRVALEPDTCVDRTRGLFARHGVRSLLVAKFIPGYDTVAPSLAGMLGIGNARFLAWSLAGATIWLLAFGLLGYAFGGQVDAAADAGARLGGALGVVLGVAFAVWLGWKYAQRRRVLRGLRMARVTPAELAEMIASGAPPEIVDVRGPDAVALDPFAIPGALFFTVEELETRHLEIARGREVVLYCT
jgi:membrane protein DedA with SNARE-associated domain